MGTIINQLIGRGVPTGVAGVMVGGTGDLATVISAASGNTAQAGATLISTGSVFISIVSASGNSVQLPSCDPNSSIDIFNGGANAANLYGQTGEKIQGGSANAKFTIAANKSARVTKYSATVWGANLSA